MVDLVGTLSDFSTLLRHNTTKRLPTAALHTIHYTQLIRSRNSALQALVNHYLPCVWLHVGQTVSYTKQKPQIIRMGWLCNAFL
jgi:hypothetical protein